jgi:hydrogenase maturation factor
MRNANELGEPVPERRRLPGADGGAPAECTDDICITCSDEGRVAEVTVVHDDGQGEVLVGGRTEMVDITLVDAGPGDLVLVHAGVAIALLGPVPGSAARRGGATVTSGPVGTLYPFTEAEASGGP